MSVSSLPRNEIVLIRGIFYIFGIFFRANFGLTYCHNSTCYQEACVEAVLLFAAVGLGRVGALPASWPPTCRRLSSGGRTPLMEACAAMGAVDQSQRSRDRAAKIMAVVGSLVAVGEDPAERIPSCVSRYAGEPLIKWRSPAGNGAVAISS